MISIAEAKKIMGRNFIGPRELSAVSAQLGINAPAAAVPEIAFDARQLKRLSGDHLLILGVPTAADGSPLTLHAMRAHFGVDPAKAEPCFYNQDWYLKEQFASETTLEPRWYLVCKNLVEATRGKSADAGKDALAKSEQLPTAILTAYAFFANYFLNNGEMLWKNDFVWCADTDHNGDRIYTGRYIDPNGVNKNGFNIHRHLSIRPCYGIASVK